MKNDLLTIIVKPTSECNFRCKYCYHASTNYEKGILEISKLEKLIRVAQEYQRKDLITKNSIQTNGSLLSESNVKFFKENNFNVGISFDGPGDCNVLRQSSEKVMRNIEQAQQSGLKLSALSVIHALNFNKQIEMYDFFKSAHLAMKFNPIFNSGSATQSPEYLLEVDQYFESLKTFYDYWLLDQTAVRVDPLDQYIHMKLFGRGIDCIYGSCLYHWIGVDSKGDFYPCGRSYGIEYRVGSISEITQISSIFKHPNYIELLKKSIVRRSVCQNNCDYYGICNGGCNNSALIENGQLEISGGFLCEMLRRMYEYVSKSVEKILETPEEIRKYNPLIRELISKANEKHQKRQELSKT
jgi:uncharacterized protein